MGKGRMANKVKENEVKEKKGKWVITKRRERKWRKVKASTRKKRE